MIPQKYTLYLGESVSGEIYPSPVKDGEVLIGTKVTGLKGFVEFLELHLGLRCEHPSEALQLEAYLQALEKAKAGTFYEQSLQVDSYSVAKDLYAKRIELLEAGFSFKMTSLPPRFKELKEVENHFELKQSLVDRSLMVLETLNKKHISHLGEIILLKDLKSFPPIYVQLLKKLESQGVVVQEIQYPSARPKIKKIAVKNELEAGLVITKLQQQQKDSLIYLQQDQDIYDLFRRQMGQPSIGAEVSSFARPVMQLVYLATEFLWDPLDPRKVIEFFNLPVKPFPSKLASTLAEILGKTPGFGGRDWNREVEAFFAAETDDAIIKKNRKRLEIFFGRDRYPKTGADIKDIAEFFSFLSHYLRSREFIIESNAINSISNLLKLVAYRQKKLSKLELDKLLENYLPSISYSPSSKQVGANNILNSPENLIASAKKLIWYPFCDNGNSQKLFFWNRIEAEYLKGNGINLLLPFEKVRQKMDLERRLLNSIEDEVYLIIPDHLDGEMTAEHPMIHSLEYEEIQVAEIMHDQLEKVNIKLIPSIRTEWKLNNTDKFIKRETESFSSLEKLFYWPWIYVLENYARLKSKGVLSIGDDLQIRGTFTHLFFEEYFNSFKTPEQMRANPSDDWFESNVEELINQYGVLWRQDGFETLLSLLKGQIKKGLHVLSQHLIENDWTVVGMEEELVGNIFDTKFSGVMDMALIRGDERCVVDLKYAGDKKHRDRLEKNQDLQLSLYSKQNGSSQMPFCYTGYFIISTSHLYTKDTAAFKNPNGKKMSNYAEAYSQLWEQMENTYYARLNELNSGQILIRDELTGKKWVENNIRGKDYLDLSDAKGNNYHEYQVLVGFKRK
jgi:hypothetical protein